MSKIKLYLALILFILAGIVFLQNTETVNTRILFFTVSMPRAALLIISLLTGFAAGFAAGAFYRTRSDDDS